MKALVENASYIENVTFQEEYESDWTAVRNTKVNLLPRKIYVSSSTTTELYTPELFEGGDITLTFNDNSFKTGSAKGSISNELSLLALNAKKELLPYSAEFVSSIKLETGNVFVAYKDITKFGYGTFSIINGNYDIIINKKVFDSSEIEDIELFPLLSGSVLIKYTDVSTVSGKFVIISSEGSFVHNPIRMSSNKFFFDARQLENNNIFKAYNDGGVGYYEITSENNTSVFPRTLLTNSQNGENYISVAVSTNKAVVVYKGDIVEVHSGKDISADASYSKTDAFPETFKDFQFNDSGSRIYVLDNDGNTVKQYILSTNYDVATATYSSSYTFTSETGDTSGGGTPVRVCFAIANQGRNIYFHTTDGDFILHTLNSPWEISSASSSYTHKEDLTGNDANSSSSGMVIARGGKYLYLLYLGQITMYDISYYSASSVSSVATFGSGLNDFFFNTEGTVLYTMIGTTITQYNLSFPWEIDGASSFSTFTLNSSGSHITNSYNTDKFFVQNYSSFDIDTYNIATPGNTLLESGVGIVKVLNDSGATLVPEKKIINNPSYFVTFSMGDNVFIFYQDGDNNNYGTLIIVDSNGDIVRSPEVFESSPTNILETKAIGDSNVMIMYEDINNNNNINYAIFRYDGVLIQAPTIESLNLNSQNIDVSALDEGFVVVYADDSDSGKGKAVVYSSGGNLLQDPIAITENTIEACAVTHIRDNLISIEWSEANETYFNYFNIGSTNIIDISNFGLTETPTNVFYDDKVNISIALEQTERELLFDGPPLTFNDSTTSSFSLQLLGLVPMEEYSLSVGQRILLDSVENTVTGISSNESVSVLSGNNYKTINPVDVDLIDNTIWKQLDSSNYLIVYIDRNNGSNNAVVYDSSLQNILYGPVSLSGFGNWDYDIKIFEHNTLIYISNPEDYLYVLNQDLSIVSGSSYSGKDSLLGWLNGVKMISVYETNYYETFTLYANDSVVYSHDYDSGDNADQLHYSWCRKILNGIFTCHEVYDASKSINKYYQYTHDENGARVFQKDSYGYSYYASSAIELGDNLWALLKCTSNPNIIEIDYYNVNNDKLRSTSITIESSVYDSYDLDKIIHPHPSGIIILDGATSGSSLYTKAKIYDVYSVLLNTYTFSSDTEVSTPDYQKNQSMLIDSNNIFRWVKSNNGDNEFYFNSLISGDFTEIVVNFNTVTTPPSKIEKVVTAIPLAETAREFIGDYFSLTFEDLERGGRAVQRRIEIPTKGTQVIEPMISEIYK